MARAKKPEAQCFGVKPLRTNGDCELCPLGCDSKTVCCESAGPKNAEIMILGGALNAFDEAKGRPMVGDSGRKLNYLLERSQLNRNALRIGNLVRCKPTGPKPKAAQAVACWPYSLYDILVGKPKVVVTMGGWACNELSQRSLAHRGFPEWRTFKYKKHEHSCWVINTFHPSQCLHDWAFDDTVVSDLKLAAEYAAGNEVLKWPSTKVHVVKELDEALNLLGRLGRVEKFVVDVETTGLSPHTSRILCVGFCWKKGEAWILPLRQQSDLAFWKPAEFQKIVHALGDLLEEAAVIGQNIKFDLKHLRKLTGVVEYEVAFDTLLAHHCVDENKPHNLTFLCQQYLHWQKYDELTKHLTGANGMADVPNEVLWKYCGFDVDGEWQLTKILDERVVDEGVTKAFLNEMSLIVPMADMEYRGMKVHRERVRVLSAVYRLKIAKADKALNKIAVRHLAERYEEVCGKDKAFNPRSPKQLGELLTIVTKGKLTQKTPSGLVKTSANVMEALVLKKNTAARIARYVIDLRLWGPKYVSQFLDGQDGRSGVLSFVEGNDRVHTNYNLGIPRTGRLSSTDPAMQTIPRNGGIRTMFVPDTPSDVLIQADYAKLELCILSWLANDRVMGRELLKGDDLHSRMALTRRLNRDPTDKEFIELSPTVGKEERAVAKGVNFGIPYGRGSYSIVVENPGAFPAPMPMFDRQALVQKVIDAYFQKYWAIKAYMDERVAMTHRQHYLFARLFERKRRLHGMGFFNHKFGLGCTHHNRDIGHIENEARNFEIQSSASDLANSATRRVWDGQKAACIPGFRMIMCLHDALIFNVRRTHAVEACTLIKHSMESVLPKRKGHSFAMPLKVDVEVQDYWGQEFMEREEKLELDAWFKPRGVGAGSFIAPENVRRLPPRYTRRMRRTA